MIEILSLIMQQAQKLPFELSYIFIFLAILVALINIVFAPVGDFDLSMFAKRTLGSILAIFIMIIASISPPMASAIWAPVSFICLVMIREITVALKFTGLDLTPLTIFVNLGINSAKAMFRRSPSPKKENI